MLRAGEARVTTASSSLKGQLNGCFNTQAGVTTMTQPCFSCSTVEQLRGSHAQPRLLPWTLPGTPWSSQDASERWRQGEKALTIQEHLGVGLIQFQDSQRCLHILRVCVSSAPDQVKRRIPTPLLLAKRQGRAAEGKKQHRKTAAGVKSQNKTVMPEIRKGSLQRLGS